MGYATVAGLPPVSGIHATIVALVAYALVGPSRKLIVGPDSALIPVLAAAIAPFAADDPDKAVAAAGAISLMAGLILLVAGRLRLGLVGDLLSRPVRIGFLNGVAATLLVSQLPALFGFEGDGDTLVNHARHFVDGLTAGETSRPALLLGVGALVALALLARALPTAPGVLAVVIGTALVVWAAEVDGDVPLVGPLPRELPSPTLGGLGWADVARLVPASLGIALIATAGTTLLARAMNGPNSHVDPDHDMAALGVVNMACGALGGFPAAGSSSRTPVAVRSGSRSQATGLAAAALILGLLLAVPEATTLLPQSALAAVVIAAAIMLADVSGLSRLWRARRLEALLAVAAFLGVVIVGVLPGIAVAVVVSLIAFVARAWYPYSAELVRVDQRKGYHDSERHPEGRRIPGLVIARFDAPLFFANARIFTAFVEDLVHEAPFDVRWVIIAAEPITDVDTTAGDELAALDDQLAEHDVRMVFAEMKGPVKDRLDDYGLDERFGPDRFFPTLGTATSAYVDETDTEWTDWTER